MIKHLFNAFVLLIGIVFFPFAFLVFLVLWFAVISWHNETYEDLIDHLKEGLSEWRRIYWRF